MAYARRAFDNVCCRFYRRLTPVAMLLVSLAAPAQSASYKIDPEHSQLIFRIGHLGISANYGRFNDLGGSFTLDGNGDLTAANASVKSKNIDTAVLLRDLDVRAQYIDAMRFPTISYTVQAIEKLPDDSYRLTGKLDLHGIVKDVTAVAKKIGSGPGMRGEERVGAEASFAIKRSDYGMTFGLPGVGDDVQILLNIEGVKQ